MRLYVVFLMAIIILSACASGPDISNEERALVLGQRTVHQSVARSFTTSETQQSFRVRARYNPVQCDLPEFEVYGHEKWNRAYLDGSREILSEVQGFKDRSSGSYAMGFLDVEGTFSGTRRAQSGVRYPVFVVVGLP
ncbi:MAG: hypothetical protein ACNA8W_12960 [Bradymonadaceae bacterium]